MRDKVVRVNNTVNIYVVGQKIPILSKEFEALEDAKAFELYVEENYIEFLNTL